MRSATTGPDEPGRRSRVHELGRMSRTQLIVIYQGLCDSTEGKAPRAVAGWSRDQLITAIRNREDGPWPEPVEDAEGAYSADGQCAEKRIIRRTACLRCITIPGSAEVLTDR